MKGRFISVARWWIRRWIYIYLPLETQVERTPDSSSWPSVLYDAVWEKERRCAARFNCRADALTESIDEFKNVSGNAVKQLRKTGIVESTDVTGEEQRGEKVKDGQRDRQTEMVH